MPEFETFRKRSRQVKSHNHSSFDVKPLGQCPSCDNYHERLGVTSAEVEQAFWETRGLEQLYMLAMLGRVDPDRHEELVTLLGEATDLADAVDEVFENGSIQP